MFLLWEIIGDMWCEYSFFICTKVRMTKNEHEADSGRDGARPQRNTSENAKQGPDEGGLKPNRCFTY